MRCGVYAKPRAISTGRWSGIACAPGTSRPSSGPVVVGTIDGEVLTVAAILHDIGLYPGASRGGVYTADGAALAREMLPAYGWHPERIELCAVAIDHHHELRNQLRRGPEVEALRLADLVELSGGLLTFGLDRHWLYELNRSVPRRGLVGELFREVGRAIRERPLTMPQIFWRS